MKWKEKEAMRERERKRESRKRDEWYECERVSIRRHKTRALLPLRENPCEKCLLKVEVLNWFLLWRALRAKVFDLVSFIIFLRFQFTHYKIFSSHKMLLLQDFITSEELYDAVSEL